MKSINLIPSRVREKMAHIGIGGWKCPCCAPPKGISRKAIGRRIRRRLKQEMDKELREINE